MMQTPISSWNGPHSGVVPILPRAAITWGDAGKPFEQKWKPGPYRFEDCHVRYDIGQGPKATASEFGAAAKAAGGMVLQGLFNWKESWDPAQNPGASCPDDLCNAGIERTIELAREIRSAAPDGGLVLTDHEDDLTLAKCHVTTAILKQVGFRFVTAVNRQTAHRPMPVPHLFHAAGAMDGCTTCISIYDHPAMMNDLHRTLAAINGPLVVVVSNRQTTPEHLAMVRKWKNAGGNLRHAVIWNHAQGVDAAADRAIVKAINGPVTVPVVGKRTVTPAK